MKVNVKHIKREYEGFFTLEKARLQFEKFDGSKSKEIERENFYRGDSVAALVYDSRNEKVTLVRQFRYPVYSVDPEHAWLIELVAGRCEKNENPQETLVRELKEEMLISIVAEQLEYIGQFFLSPGGTSERIYLYAADVDLSNFEEQSGGREEEDENIQILHFSTRQVIDLLERGDFRDAKTIIALQWLKARFNPK
ncbi:NUDIX hydrolase [candidate division KSB1 bacterium]|nr:NUDIX hydrolase [candidate division KSB1 bacterium]RQW00702.1 MAG: NUDIX hydrolase [candidate division KSB1 bacterium]